MINPEDKSSNIETSLNTASGIKISTSGIIKSVEDKMEEMTNTKTSEGSESYDEVLSVVIKLFKRGY